MKYSILVMASPTAGQGSATAVSFARSLLARGHTLHNVFFQGDAVGNGLANAIFPQDERNLVGEWAALAEQHKIELILCISSALRRGVLDKVEAQRYERAASTLHPAFTIGGLGQLVDASANSDRLITFGH
jgi:tRNA 2-thiouridine synthesizing protein D